MRRTQHMDEPDIDDCIKDFIDQQTPPQSPDDEVPEENKEHIINEETKPINKRPNKKELQQESAKKSKLAKIRTAAEWTEHITNSSNRPPSGAVTSAQVGGKGPANVHSTHDAWLVNNITFCRACGYYMELKSTNLREECIRAPPNGQYKMCLTFMKNGYHPRSKAKEPKDWSDGSSGATPIMPVKLNY